MVKMWTGVVVVVVGACAVLVTPVSGQSTDYEFAPGDCNETSNVVTRCNQTFALFYGFGTFEQDCMLMLETVACIETAMCHCNFSGNHPQLEIGYRMNMLLLHYYNNLTQCGNQTYADTIQSDVLGPVDVQEGVNCTKYNRTAGDLSLSLSVAQIPVVLEVEEICPGIQDCYHQYDRGLELALFQKNYSQFCQESVILLECLVNVSCECGQSAHETVVNMVYTERTIFRDTCSAIVSVSAFTEIGITCPGTDTCDSLDPQYNCLVEFEAAATSALTYPQYCTALFDLANCTEELACECGFYQEPTYYRSLAIAKYNYVNATGCEPLTGPFPSHSGLNCGIDNRFTDEEKLLTISLTEPEFVDAEELTCPGVKDCHVTANAKSSEAHRMKDLSAICQTESERITCLEEAYCACGRLSQMEVYNRLYEMRVNHNDLCYSVTGFPPLIRCRGLSTCLRNDPLTVCQSEYNYDSAIAGQNYELQCRASKNYITCTEEVGCACGLLADGTSLAAETVYNFTTLSLKIYDKAGCPRLIGDIRPDDDGINCEGTTDDDTRRKLVLSYADSSEVAALARDCPEVRDCFKTHDKYRAEALMRRSYTSLCRVQSQLVGCVDDAYCICGINGTEGTEDYIATQMRAHEEFCSDIVPIRRKPCTRELAAMSEQCREVNGCYDAFDTSLLKSRPPCLTHLALIGCMDSAYCKCAVNGTVGAERSIARLTSTYSSRGCGAPSKVQRKTCDAKTTGAADVIRQYLCLLVMLLIAVAVMT